MKSVIHRDGRIDLDGTPEELAAYERARVPVFRWSVDPLYPQVIAGFESAEIGRASPVRPSTLGRGTVPISCRCGAVGFDPESPRPRLEVLYGEQHAPEACIAPKATVVHVPHEDLPTK